MISVELFGYEIFFLGWKTLFHLSFTFPILNGKIGEKDLISSMTNDNIKFSNKKKKD